MGCYKHYSFDLWLTLIKSNTLFKKTRSRIFHEQYNFHSRSLEEVEHIFRSVDVMANTINERTGLNMDAYEMYLMVISLMNDHKVNLHDIDIEALYSEMDNLLFEFLPQLYSTDTIPVLAEIKEHDNTVNILSNTGFIKGCTLRKVLQELKMDVYFDFQLYSDEAGFSKPNRQFFDLMIAGACKLQPLELQQILHIGDNIKADIAGAAGAGICSLQINSNDVSIKQLTNHVPSRLLTT
ncbi:MAG: HAD family hydrolase [Sphingobacteriales bacterium]|nr:MAG: HAD family hydrolase [Sphingobacteriales bacterium]